MQNRTTHMYFHQSRTLPLLYNCPVNFAIGGHYGGCLVQGISTAKVLLHTKRARLLPAIVLEREDARLRADLVLDLLDSDLLVLRAGNSRTVGLALCGPSNLGDVLALCGSAGAHLGGLLELLRGKVTGHVGGDGGGEVRVHLHGEDVNVVAQRGALLLPGADGLGGGDGNVRGEAAGLELLADIVDVGGELAGHAVAVEDALVADNDHGDAVLGRVVLDVLELGVGVVGERSLSAGAAALKEDAIDDFEAILLALGNDVGEDAAVGAVGADSSEAHLGDLLDVGLDLVGRLALAAGGIRSVCDGPLVAVGHDAATGAVATGWLGLVSSLRATGSWLGAFDRLRGNRCRSVDGDRLGRLLGRRRRVDLSWLARSRDRRWRRLHVNRGRLDGGIDGSLCRLRTGS